MVAKGIKKEEVKQQEIKLYRCAKCGKEVVADDYNNYYGICFTCEKTCGNSLIR